MVLSLFTTLVGFFAGTTCLYLFFLSKRLHGPHPASNPQPSLSEQDLDKVGYDDIDMLQAIPAQATHENYAVIGGSGYLGTYIVKLLILRGETKIRILDLHPPHPDIASHPSVSFFQTDIASLQSVRVGLTTPFSEKSGPANVIYHTASIIRFWERVVYAWPLSHNVNVQGTANVLSVAKKIPKAIVIYTSTADLAVPRANFLRLGLDYKRSPWNKVIISDYDAPLAPSQRSDNSYTRSKVMAERLVVGSNGWNGLRTGIIRPGCIIGPNDRLLTSVLTMPRVPIFDKLWSHTNVCVWDVAAAHLLYEDAMRRIPEESAGQTFLITGKGAPWSLHNTRTVLKYYSSRPLVYTYVSPLFIYILAHLVELGLLIRYYSILPFAALRRSKPSLAPRWMGELQYLQPSTFQYMTDITIDDSRAREILGYRPQWSTIQCIKYTVDEVQSGKAREGHGLQLKSD